MTTFYSILNVSIPIDCIKHTSGSFNQLDDVSV